MHAPKVTVITPAYNAADFIGESIESVLRQTFAEFEYIVIDNASTDRTWEVIQAYRQDPRVVAVRNETNLGIAGNRNKAVALAKGEYIVWQDADDISMPQRIEHQLGFMEQHPEVGICGGWLQFFGDRHAGVRKYAPTDMGIRKNIFRYSPVAQPGAIVRKKVFHELGIFNTTYPMIEDLEMALRIGTKYQFANLQEIVIRYRENEGSATHTKLTVMEKNTIAIRKLYARNSAYHLRLSDALYLFFQRLSMYVIPARIKIRLFNALRNSKS